MTIPPQHRLSPRDGIDRQTEPDPGILLLSFEVALADSGSSKGQLPERRYGSAMGNGYQDPDRYGAKGPYPWVGGPRMTPAELESVAARHGLTMAEINARCGEGDEWNCEGFRDWWARMASIRTQSEDDRRRGRSGSSENAARQILFAAEVYGIRDLADEAMEVIAAELCRPSCRPARESG